MGKTIKKSYTKSKAFDPSCRCTGGCPYCEGNRKHKHKKQPKLKKLLQEYYEDET